MNKWLYGGCLALLFAGINILFVYSKNEGTEKVERQYTFNKDYKIHSISRPDALSFAGESIPLDQPDIYERFDKEITVNTYWQSQSILHIKKANKYFPIIEPILKKNGVPDDFKYLAIAESGLDQIVSPAGATGIWQLMKGTAKELGLEVNKEVDERYHIEKSTEAACQYILKCKEELGSWVNAVGAYNVGLAGMKKQIKRQNSTHYFDLLLNKETSRYLFRILAAKEIISSPKYYGFYVPAREMYSFAPTYEVQVDTAVTFWADFAEDHQVNYKILKRYNPWLRENFLTNKVKKPYSIKVPKEGYYNTKND